MNLHFGVRIREAVKVVSIPGEDVGSSPLYGMSYDDGIDGVGGACGSEEPAGGTAMGLSRLGNRAYCLQDSVHRGVTWSSTDRLRYDDHRDLDGYPQLKSPGKEGPRSLVSSGQGDDCAGIEDQALRRLDA